MILSTEKKLAIVFLFIITVSYVQALTPEEVLRRGFFSNTERFYVDAEYESNTRAKYGKHLKRSFQDVFITTTRATDVFEKRYFNEKEKYVYTYKNIFIKTGRRHYLVCVKRETSNGKTTTTLKTPSEEQKSIRLRKKKAGFDYKTYSNSSVQSNGIYKVKQTYQRKAKDDGLKPIKPYAVEWLEAWLRRNGGKCYSVVHEAKTNFNGNCATIKGTKTITGYLGTVNGFRFDLPVELRRSYHTEIEVNENDLNIYCEVEEVSQEVSYASRKVKISYSAKLNDDNTIISEKEKVNTKADEGFTRIYMNFINYENKEYGGLPGWRGKSFSGGKMLEKDEACKFSPLIQPNVFLNR